MPPPAQLPGAKAIEVSSKFALGGWATRASQGTVSPASPDNPLSLPRTSTAVTA